MSLIDLDKLVGVYNDDAKRLRQRFRDKTGTIVAAATDGAITCQALDGREFSVSMHSKYTAPKKLADEQQRHLAVASLAWWTYATRQDWDALTPHQRRGHTSSTFAADRSRAGTQGCTRAWTHCDYCRHGRSMNVVARFLAHGEPRLHVVIRAASGGLDSRQLRDETAKVFDTIAAAQPRSNLAAHGAVMLVPSMSSSSPDLDNSLHLHVVTNVGVSLDVLSKVAQHFGLHVRHNKHFHKLHRGSAGQGWILAYAVQQADARIYKHTCWDRQPTARDKGPTVWTPVEKNLRAIRSRPDWPTLHDAGKWVDPFKQLLA